jgi:D-alanine-D-alanine ligase
MDKKIKLGIICARNLRTSTGSINTVANLLENLDADKYEIQVILIDDLVSEESRIPESELVKDPSYVPFEKVQQNSKVLKVVNLSELSLGELKANYDAAIVAIYNTYGEDGRIIGLLETAGVAYVSPGLKTSALCLDKTLTKMVLKESGLKVPRGFEIYKENLRIEDLNSLITEGLNYPVIIKTVSSGASRGVSLVGDSSQLAEAVNGAFRYSDEALVEEFISGDEFTVGVIGDYKNPKALPVVQIRTKNSFFDYQAKYEKGAAEELCPAPISSELTQALQEEAIKAYQGVKGTSHSRIDLIVHKGAIYVLEINTFPGLTMSSLFPKELEAAGSSLKEFLDTSLSALI